MLTPPRRTHELPEVARAVAIIMDGNGRWAQRRGLDVAEGHRAGSRALRPVVETAIDLGVESLAVYAFSTENWTRSQDEVDALMEIFGETIDRELADLADAGRAHALHRPARPRAGVAAGEDGRARGRRPRDKTRLNLWIAFDYGGRAELVEAARRIVESGVEPDDDRRGRVRRDTSTRRSMPDPDLVIRTSGELRISNFLLWQSAYAEFVFVDTLWPDFGPDELRAAIEEYAQPPP